MAVAQQLKTSGSPYAAELDARLKSNEPLSSIVEWWDKKYDEWRPTLDAQGVVGIGPISDHEMTVFCIFGPEDSPSPNVQKGWDFLRQDRAALQASSVATP
jgi:hypothetical protein